MQKISNGRSLLELEGDRTPGTADLTFMFRHHVLQSREILRTEHNETEHGNHYYLVISYSRRAPKQSRAGVLVAMKCYISCPVLERNRAIDHAFLTPQKNHAFRHRCSEVSCKITPESNISTAKKGSSCYRF